MSKKDVMIVTGAGQLSMAIARRVGYGKKIVMGDKNINNAKAIAEIMNNAGLDVEPMEMDLSSRESILKLIAKAQEYFAIYNNMKRSGTAVRLTTQTYYSILTQTHGKASECLKCGKCEKLCPQHLPIRTYLQDVAAALE